MTTVADALQIAIQHHRANHLAEAKEHYSEILAAQPDQPEALYGLGVLAQQLGQFPTAEHCLSYLLQLQPNSVKGWVSLGNLHQAQRQWSDAVSAYKQALAIDPNWVAAYNNLGYTWQQQGKWPEALKCYQKALALQPQCGEAYLNLGQIYQAQNNLTEAIAAYRQGLSLLNPRYAQAMGSLAPIEPEQTPPPLAQGKVLVGEYWFPAIPPVPQEQEPRPFWSVVIPVYNRREYLLECLSSVLAQWPGHEEMEILVLDNASNPPLAELVNALGGGIVRYYRQKQNLGAVPNFNAGIALSRGEWIHLLHDDDYVLPSFYSRLQQSLEECSESVGAAFTGFENINEQGQVTFRQQVYGDYRGIAQNWLSHIGVSNLLNLPAVVVRRTAHERLGGYHPDLAYTTDWELFKRLATFYQWWYEPGIRARYRQHQRSTTTELLSAGAQAISIRRAIEISESYLPADSCAEITAKSRRHYFQHCLVRLSIPLKAGNVSGAIDLLQEILQLDRSCESVAKLFKWLSTEEATPVRNEIASKLLFEREG